MAKQKAATTSGSILTMDPAQLATTVTSATKLLTQLQGLLSGLVQYTTEERTHTTGKLRDGGSAALENIVKTVGSFPGLFESLADKDNGTSDTELETAPTLNMLARITELKPLSDSVTELAQQLSDTTLAMGSSVRELTTPAYGIIRANSAVNAKLASASSKARTFYGDIGRKSARTRTKAKATAATPKA